MTQTVRSRTTSRDRDSVSPFHLTHVVSGITALRDPFSGSRKQRHKQTKLAGTPTLSETCHPFIEFAAASDFAPKSGVAARGFLDDPKDE